MGIRAVLSAFWVFLWVPFMANAQMITFDGCRDIRGIPVASLLDVRVQDVAIAGLAPDGTPIIRYNPNVLSWFHPKTRLWWYGHECGHHALGHNFGTTHPMRVEQDADCFGIRSLVDAGLVDDGDISAIQLDLSRLGPGDWSHLPGPVRAVNLRQCLQGARSARIPSPHLQQLFCCDSFGMRRCPIIANSSSVGSPCFCPGQGYGATCQ